MIGGEIIFLGEVDSTNRYLMERIERERIPEGLVVRAAYQSAGRGLGNNKWESDPGLNLTFSFAIYPSYLKADEQFWLNKAVSLGLADCIGTEVTPSSGIKIKWPNDICAGDRKLAGILIQNGVKGDRLEFSIVGIGLNVNQVDFPAPVIHAVSLRILDGTPRNLDELLKKLLPYLESRLDMLRQGDWQQLHGDYLRYLYRFGTPGFYVYKGRKIRAKITGVNRYGQLILEVPGRKDLECNAKEVEFVG